MSARCMLVTGAGGMVGRYVPEIFADGEVVLTDLAAGQIRLDVCDPEAVMASVARTRPEFVLHLAAATDVDRCEQEPDWAYRVNAIGTQNVALACLAHGAVMVYVSTAAVFWGDQPDPYTEFDPTRPSNCYGRSKLAGEQIVTSLLSRFYMIRAGWMIGGGLQDKKFVGKIARQITGGATSLSAVNDKWGSPTYAKDFLQGVRMLLGTGYYGLYHMVNAGCCTRYDIALAVRDALQCPEVAVTPVSSDAFPLPAPRGRSEALRNYKLELLGIRLMRPWQEALREYVQHELAPGMSVRTAIEGGA